MPSIEAMLITFAGRSWLPAAFSAPCSAWVRKKGDLRFRSITLSQPLSGNSSKSAPQAAPALLTRMSSFGSRARKPSASALHAVDRRDVLRQRDAVAGRSSAAVASQASALREEM